MWCKFFLVVWSSFNPIEKYWSLGIIIPGSLIKGLTSPISSVVSCCPCGCSFAHIPCFDWHGAPRMESPKASEKGVAARHHHGKYRQHSKYFQVSWQHKPRSMRSHGLRGFMVSTYIKQRHKTQETQAGSGSTPKFPHDLFQIGHLPSRCWRFHRWWI